MGSHLPNLARTMRFLFLSFTSLVLLSKLCRGKRCLSDFDCRGKPPGYCISGTCQFPGPPRGRGGENFLPPEIEGNNVLPHDDVPCSDFACKLGRCPKRLCQGKPTSWTSWKVGQDWVGFLQGKGGENGFQQG